MSRERWSATKPDPASPLELTQVFTGLAHGEDTRAGLEIHTGITRRSAGRGVAALLRLGVLQETNAVSPAGRGRRRARFQLVDDRSILEAELVESEGVVTGLVLPRRTDGRALAGAAVTGSAVARTAPVRDMVIELAQDCLRRLPTHQRVLGLGLVLTGNLSFWNAPEPAGNPRRRLLPDQLEPRLGLVTVAAAQADVHPEVGALGPVLAALQLREQRPIRKGRLAVSDVLLSPQARSVRELLGATTTAATHWPAQTRTPTATGGVIITSPPSR